jgi:hypothetical protein
VGKNTEGVHNSKQNSSFLFKKYINMKNLLVHGVYLSVITVLSFLLYDKIKTDDFVFMKSSEALEHDYKFLDNVSRYPINEIRKMASAIPKYDYLLDATKKINAVYENLDFAISKFKNDKKVTEKEIKTFKSLVENSNKETISLFSNEIDRKDIEKNISLKGLISNDTFIKTLNCNNNHRFLTQINMLKNTVIKDKLTLLSYLQNQIRFCGYIEDFRVIIEPTSSTVISGEKFKANIYLAAHTIFNDSILSISANGSELNHKNGIANYESTPKKVGRHNILATITRRNSLTSQTETIQGEIKYEVIPKYDFGCSPR